MSKAYTQKEFRIIMRPAIAAAVMLLIGGESLQLISFNLTPKERLKQDDMVSLVHPSMLS